MLLKVMTVIGTRPEAIKHGTGYQTLKPTIRRRAEFVVCITAQHREMLDQALQIFGIVPDYDLN